MKKLKDIIYKLGERLFLPKGFYDLNRESEIIHKLPDDKKKWVELSYLYKRYANGHLVAMSYGCQQDQQFHRKAADDYNKLADIYRDKVYEINN
jgi:hypothetical protein